jgi:uncharacterized coiled-coil protein SlyX
VRAKSNLGPDRGGLEYTLLGAPVPGHGFHAQRVDWGRPLDGSAHELMAIEAEEEDALTLAREFLEGSLANGPVAVRELKPAALANGHGWRTVERAKADLGIKAIKRAGGAWYWEFPSDADPAADQQHRRQDGCGGVGEDGGQGPLFEANPATTPQDRHTEFGGGVVDAAELQRRIADLEDSIAAKREQVKTLASLQYRTGEAEEQLRQMERRLRTLQQSLARPGHEGEDHA